MYYQKITKDQARNEMGMGLKNYLDKNNRIEYLTLSISTNDTHPIMDYFEILQKDMLYKKRFGYVDFCGVCIEQQHLHCFIRKPFLKREYLISYWNRITGNSSNARCYTVFDKGVCDQAKLKRIYDYILSQEGQGDVFYFRSPSWGIAHKKEIKPKDKKEIRFLSDIKKNLMNHEDYELTLDQIHQSREDYNK